MKSEIIAGDTLNFLTTTPDYPANDGWVLTYRIVPKAAGPAPININASAEGVDHRVIVAAATTAAYTAGDYSFEAYVTKAAERYRVDSGQVKILPNPATATVLDNRSHVKKMLEAINAALEGRASSTQREMIAYTIGSRSKQFDTADSKAALLELKSRYEWFCKNEDDRASIAAGLPNPRMIGVRFGSPR